MSDTLYDRLLAVAADRDLGGSSMRQLWVINAISTGCDTVRDLAKQSGMNKPAITRAWTELQSQGLVSAATDKADRRLVRLKLTAVGKRVHARRDIGALAEPILARFIEANGTLLTVRQLLLLIYLVENEAPQDRALRAIWARTNEAGLSVAKPAWVRAMDVLEELGLGARESNRAMSSGDRRLTIYEPTQKGIDLVTDLSARWASANKPSGVRHAARR